MAGVKRNGPVLADRATQVQPPNQSWYHLLQITTQMYCTLLCYCYSTLYVVLAIYLTLYSSHTVRSRYSTVVLITSVFAVLFTQFFFILFMYEFM